MSFILSSKSESVKGQDCYL